MRDPFKPASGSRLSKIQESVEDVEPIGDTAKADRAAAKLKNKKAGKGKAKEEADNK